MKLVARNWKDVVSNTILTLSFCIQAPGVGEGARSIRWAELIIKVARDKWVTMRVRYQVERGRGGLLFHLARHQKSKSKRYTVLPPTKKIEAYLSELMYSPTCKAA